MFCRKLILRTFKVQWYTKPSLTSKPSLTIALKILKTIEKPLKPMVGGLCTVHGSGAPGAPRAPKTLRLRVLGAPGAPGAQGAAFAP